MTGYGMNNAISRKYQYCYQLLPPNQVACRVQGGNELADLWKVVRKHLGVIKRNLVTSNCRALVLQYIFSGKVSGGW